MCVYTYIYHSKTLSRSFREKESRPKFNTICKLFSHLNMFKLSYFYTFTYCV